jgi:hypothetical protein
MTDMTEPTHLEHWPAMLAQLDAEQYEALAVTFSALAAGHMEAVELAEFSMEANRLAIALDIATTQGPDALRALERAQTREAVVADIANLATEIASLAADLEMVTGRLATFDEEP